MTHMPCGRQSARHDPSDTLSTPSTPLYPAIGTLATVTFTNRGLSSPSVLAGGESAAAVAVDELPPGLTAVVADVDRGELGVRTGCTNSDCKQAEEEHPQRTKYTLHFIACIAWF